MIELIGVKMFFMVYNIDLMRIIIVNKTNNNCLCFNKEKSNQQHTLQNSTDSNFILYVGTKV